MHWADTIAKEIISSGKYRPYWVDDMKTPSGYAHIGSMLGPIIHSCVYRALRDAGQKAILTYVFNDFDTADEFPPNFKDELKEHAGKVLKMIPSPISGFDNLADLLADDLKKSLEYLGFEARCISSWELYHQGKFDVVIREALDASEKIQDIYKKVSGSAKKEKGWLPFQVVCESCGKLGTTRVFAWDGKEVSYKCEPHLVTWAEGCGYEGKISPFGGNGKLPWKVDWAAHWKVIGVTIEGAGKDHASAGGSYDVAMTICKEVFKYPKPYKLPYEFILIGGKKMSSSKGLGLKAHDLVNILPAEVARFLFVNSDIKSQSNFDPVGTDAIPDLFDKYDEAWQDFNNSKATDLARAFELSQISSLPERSPNLFLSRFRDITNYKQLPNIDLWKKLEEIKGNILTETELKIFKEREKYASIWLGKYAPVDEQMQMSEVTPSMAKELTDHQKRYLNNLIPIVEREKTPEGLQLKMFELVKKMNMHSLDAFSAIYKALIGKDRGPRAAWFLLQYPKRKVIDRLNQVVSGQFDEEKGEEINFIDVPDYFVIDESVKAKFPSISVGVALIKGVSISETGKELQIEINEFLSSQQGLTTEVLGQYSEIISYRKLYKEMGVDWHSRRPGPEELLRRIALKKGLYNINNCVDAYNLSVMKNNISVGAFDADKIKFPANLRFGINGDKVLLIGNKEPVSFTSKELVYYDQAGAYNLDFNYRDSQRTMVAENTRNILVNVDGIFDVTPEKVQETLDEAVDRIIKYCGGKLEFKGVVK